MTNSYHLLIESYITDKTNKTRVNRNKKKRTKNEEEITTNEEGSIDAEEVIDDTDSVGSILEELEDLNTASEESRKARVLILIKEEDNSNEVVKNEDTKAWVLQKGVGEATMPVAPDDWEIPKPKKEFGEPESFDTIDNPGVMVFIHI